MATRRDPNKRAGVWSMDTLYPKQKKYTLEELMALTNAPARPASGPMVNTNPSLLQAARGIVEAGDWETFQKGMPWAPAEGDAPSNMEAALIGTGRFLDKMGAGSADLLDRASINVSRGKYVDQALERRRKRREDQAKKDVLYSRLEETHPLATTLGEMAVPMASLPGGLITQGLSKTAPKAWGAAQATKVGDLLGMAKAAKNVPVPMGWGKAIGTEAALGGTAGASHYDASALEGALWGAAGGAGGKYISNLLGGTGVNLKGNAPRIVETAKKHGLFVTPGMATGKRSIQQMDQAVSTHKSSKDIFDDMLRESKVKENRLISKELGGEPTDYFDREFMDASKKRITDRMSDLANKSNGTFSEEMVEGARGIAERYRRTNRNQEIPKILESHIKDMEEMASSGRTIDGATYQRITQDLNEAASDQYGASGDVALARALKGISELYGDAIDAGNPAQSAAWKEARRQFALHSAIDKSLGQTVKKGFSGVEGFVDARKLAKNFKTSDIVNELAEIDRYRESMPGASLGTSGLLGKMLKGTVRDPSEMAGAGALLTGRLLNPIGTVDELFTTAYLKGYPHVSGVLPGFKHIKDRAATIPARALKGRESMFDKGEIVDPRIEEDEGVDDGGWQTLEQTGTPTGGMSIDFADDVDWEDLRNDPTFQDDEGWTDL